MLLLWGPGPGPYPYPRVFFLDPPRPRGSRNCQTRRALQKMHIATHLASCCYTRNSFNNCKQEHFGCTSSPRATVFYRRSLPRRRTIREECTKISPISGPSHWPGVCPMGQAQSPIAIEAKHAEVRSEKPFTFHNYDRSFKNTTLKNNGHTVVLSIEEEWCDNIPAVYYKIFVVVECEGIIDVQFQAELVCIWTQSVGHGLWQLQLGCALNSIMGVECYDATMLHGYMSMHAQFCNSQYVVNLNSPHSVSQKVSGGGLPAKYVFAQLHFHWGSVDGQGSEHKIDNVRLSAC